MLNLNLNRRSHVYMYAACWHVLTYLLTYSYGRCLRGSVVYYCNRILNLGTFVQNGPQIDLQRQPKILGPLKKASAAAFQGTGSDPI
jgi:hypothetical protein